MTVRVRRVYLDVCALCRPFDDQSQIRVRLETEAVQLILSHVRDETLTLMISPVHRVEIRATPALAEREYLLELLTEVGVSIDLDRLSIRERAEALATSGLGAADAAHLAYAEAVGADFVTTDDRLVRQCKRLIVQVWCGTPVTYCEKENLA